MSSLPAGFTREEPTVPHLSCFSRMFGRRVFAAFCVMGLGWLALDPSTVGERTRRLLFAAWATLGNELTEWELAEATGRLDEDRARLERAKTLRKSLAQRLLALRTSRRAAGTRADGHTTILKQITDLLQSQPGPVVWVGGVDYDREVVERDADAYDRLARDAQQEVAEYDQAIEELAALIVEADQLIRTVETRVRQREAQLATYRARVDSHRLRRELAHGREMPLHRQSDRLDLLLPLRTAEPLPVEGTQRAAGRLPAPSTVP